jgi:hypothetical protein
MLNGSLVITAKEGALQVDAQGQTKKVVKGQTIVVSPRTAQGKGGAGWGGGSATLEIITLGAAGAAAILAGVAVSRAGNANSNATAAIAAANAATSAANAATSTASAAASSASAAASSAAQAVLLTECLNDLAQTGTYASPYVLTNAQCAGTGN